jgi:hypothetical protein
MLPVKLADIRCVDLFAWEISGLIVIAVGMKKVAIVASRCVELILRHGTYRRLFSLG